MGRIPLPIAIYFMGVALFLKKLVHLNDRPRIYALTVVCLCDLFWISPRTGKNLYPGITFFRCILSLRSLYFWNLHNILHLLIPMKSILWRKKVLDLYIVHDPKCFDQQWSGHWVITLFLFIFVTFERFVTNFRGTFPISTHPTEGGRGAGWKIPLWECPIKKKTFYGLARRL
jgi:hypothetical protein